MQRKWILGADPGKYGAVVLLDADYPNVKDKADALKMFPTKTEGGKIDTNTMYAVLQPYAEDIVFMVQEQVHAIFGSSAKGSFEFGDANGAQRAILLLLGRQVTGRVPFMVALPKLWQKVAWQGIDPIGTPVYIKGTKTPKLLKSGKQQIKVDTKGTSMLAAHKLFPNANFVMPRCRIEHDGCIDAALIAYYGLTRYNKLKKGS